MGVNATGAYCYKISANVHVYLSLDLIIPGLVTTGTAKICCLGLILALFESTMVIKMILDNN